MPLHLKIKLIGLDSHIYNISVVVTSPVYLWNMIYVILNLVLKRRNYDLDIVGIKLKYVLVYFKTHQLHGVDYVVRLFLDYFILVLQIRKLESVLKWMIVIGRILNTH